MAIFCRKGPTYSTIGTYHHPSPQQQSMPYHSSRMMPPDISYLYGMSPTFYGAAPTDTSTTSISATLQYTCDGRRRYSRDCYVPCARVRLARVKPCLKPAKSPTTSAANVNVVVSACCTNVNVTGCVTTAAGGDPAKSCSCESAAATKRVTFADSEGGALTTVKYMFEASNEPPKSFTEGRSVIEAMTNLRLSSDVDAGGEAPCDVETAAPTSLYTPRFEQPIADYMRFNERLERANVALESVAVDARGAMAGTIKVRNLAFDKHVTVRVTYDAWRSHVEHACTYLAKAYGGAPAAFDAFQFLIDVRNAAKREGVIEFCVRYQCAGAEFWDNNDGQNYLIDVQAPNPARPSSTEPTALSAQRTGADIAPAFIGLRWTPSTYRELPTAQQQPLYDNSSPFY